MKTEIIAEIAQAHDGSLGILHSFIDALSGSGAAAIKFQMHIAQAESSPLEPFRVHFSYQDASRFDYWKRMELSFEQWREVKSHCESLGFEFLCSPFSVAAVEVLESLNVARYKIGSGEVTNFLLLHHVAQTKKPILLSSGMSSFAELDRAIDFLRPYGNPVSILQCTTKYPTPPSLWGLNVIKELRERYGLPVGYSDHSGTMSAGIAAVALGARILEAHVAFDRRMFGPDAKASLEIDEFVQLVQHIRMLEEALEHPVDKSSASNFAAEKAIFEKALAVRTDLAAGHILKLEDLESKKPSSAGIPSCRFMDAVGRKLARSLKAHEFLTEQDLQ